MFAAHSAERFARGRHSAHRLAALAIGLQAVSFATPALANTYYVSPTGDNTRTGLSTAQAWRTPSYAASRVVAGDTILILPGTWSKDHVVFKSSGSAAAPITMKAYSTAPVLDGVDKTGEGITTSLRSWINVEGIVVRNYKTGYLTGSSSHLTLKQCEFSGMSNDGVTLWVGVSDMLIDSVKVHDTANHALHIWNQDAAGTTKNITITNSAFYNAPHNLIDLHTNVVNVVVEKNDLYFTSTYSGAKQVGLYLHNGNTDNIKIINNTFRDQPRPLEIFNSHQVVITGNTFRNIAGRGIMLAGIAGYDNEFGVFDSTIQSNVFENCDYVFLFWSDLARFRDLVIKGNTYKNIKKADLFVTSGEDTYFFTGKKCLPAILASTGVLYSVNDIGKSAATTTCTPGAEGAVMDAGGPAGDGTAPSDLHAEVTSDAGLGDGGTHASGDGSDFSMTVKAEGATASVANGTGCACRFDTRPHHGGDSAAIWWGLGALCAAWRLRSRARGKAKG